MFNVNTTWRLVNPCAKDELPARIAFLERRITQAHVSASTLDERDVDGFKRFSRDVSEDYARRVQYTAALVACLRDTVPWVPRWYMTHYMLEAPTVEVNAATMTPIVHYVVLALYVFVQRAAKLALQMCDLPYVSDVVKPLYVATAREYMATAAATSTAWLEARPRRQVNLLQRHKRPLPTDAGVTATTHVNDLLFAGLTTPMKAPVKELPNAVGVAALEALQTWMMLGSDASEPAEASLFSTLAANWNTRLYCVWGLDSDKDAASDSSAAALSAHTAMWLLLINDTRHLLPDWLLRCGTLLNDTTDPDAVPTVLDQLFSSDGTV